MATTVRDTARFGEEDCAAVVIASFSCSICLKRPELIELTGTPGHRCATSQCPQCGAVNRVTMTDVQAFKLWTLQRGDTFVHFAPEYW